MILLVLFLLVSQGEMPFQKQIISIRDSECVLLQDHETPIDLGDLIQYALSRGFTTIRIAPGDWEMNRPVQIENRDGDFRLQADSALTPPRIRGTMRLKNVVDATIEDLFWIGTLELEQTSNITIRRLYFQGGGIRFLGRKCNQPNECTSYNREIRVEDSVFEDTRRGILAERMEASTIMNNRFTGKLVQNPCGNQEVVGIEIDGSSEDVDRSLEYGHSKGNLILLNVFDQENATGIRVKNSYSNIIRENRFYRVFRALEFLEDARYSQIHSNYIGYLTSQVSTSACPGPCGIYVGPGSVNNIFVNNFFEQSFELQFLDTNRNRTYIIDESGNLNVFRSDFQPIR